MFLSVRYTLAFVVSLFLISLSAYATPPLPSFGGAEHMAIGDQVHLIFDNQLGSAGTQTLKLANGLKLSYGELVSLGDYYGLPNYPISKGLSSDDRKARFINAFNSFANNSKITNEVKQILAILHNQKKLIDEALARGEDPEKASKALSVENARKLNCITGGGCSDAWFLSPGRYLELARTDFDHFSHNAWSSYQTGHAVAIEYAIAAHRTHDSKLLALAYAVNAFASHFLSDRFAAGHIRTPRTKLPNMVTPTLTGSLLAGFMHLEENTYGLHVRNKHGDYWMVYGDQAYYTEKNKTNREILRLAMQTSADQIFAAYKTGLVPMDSVEDLIPFPIETNNNANQDISPLFYFDEKSNQLMRRVDISNPFDKHWTKNWWAWSTLILLGQHYGIPPEAQAELASSPLAEQAVYEGLITDKSILTYIQTKK